MGATGMLATALVGGGVNLFGAAKSADAQRKAGEYYQETSNTNAMLAEKQAQAVLQAGDEKAAIIGANSLEKQGAITAGEAAGNVDPFSGSAADLKSQTARFGAMDALIAKNNAAREAMGIRTEAAAFTRRGQLLRQQSENGANDTLLTGGLNFARGLLGTTNKLLDY